MKNLSLLLAMFFSFASLFGQVEEKEATMSLGNQNALVVELKNANAKTAESVWKEFIKDYGKVKKNKKAKEFYMEQTNIPAISGNGKVDVYTKFEERADMVQAYFWVDTGSAFLNSEDHTDGYNGAKVLLTEYGYAVEKHLISEELKEENKTLGKLEKEMNKLIKDNKNYHKEIEDAREKIRKAEINIEKNEVAQTNKTAEIESQKEVVKEIEARLNNVGKKKEEKMEAKEVKEEEKGEDEKG